MSNLYQDAILDAKALRASAIANAKAALEEAFEPKIQEMLRAKLSEEEVTEIAEAEEIEEVKHEEEGMKEEVAVEESAEINEQELDEILAQLEELEQVEEAKHGDKIEEVKHDELDEAKEEEEEGEEEEAEEGEEEGEAEEGESAEAEEAVGDETKVIDITLGDLKQVLQSVMGAQADAPAEEPTADSEAEAEISLDEILDELEAEGAEAVYSTGYEHGHQIPQEEGQINEDQGVIQQILGQLSPEAIDNLKTVLMTGGGAAALISALKAAFPGVKDAMKGTRSVGPGPKGMEEAKHKKEEKEELKEAQATIKTLRKDLQEVNLLNAKYLYMNKLFKSKSLTEAQKVKVINALDRAASVAEVKNAYETLKESFETKKQTIKESIGFASKPAGMAPKANIVEADQFINRWQKLAGIK